MSHRRSADNMRTRSTINLTLLLTAALGYWLLRIEDKSSSPELEPADATVQIAELSPVTTILASHDHQELQRDAVAQSMVVQDVTLPADDEDQSETLARAVEQMDATEVTSRLQELSLEQLRGDLGRLLVRRWAAIDPTAACTWATQMGDGEASQELSTAAALAWSEHDLSSALDWAQSQTEGVTRSRLLTELGYEVAREQPVEALNLAVELPQTPERDDLILHGLRQWTVADPSTARDWLLEWPESKLRQRALADFATVLAGRDGNEAARFVAEQIAPGTEQNRAVVSVVQRWAQQDRAQTLAWVDQFPAGPLRDTAVEVAAIIAVR